MGWFTGKGGTPEPEPGTCEPDEELTFLGAREADRFRATVREVLAEEGYEVTVHPGHVETDDGRRWGLWNVAAVAHGDERGPAGWPDVVRAHFLRLVAGDRVSTDDLSDEEYLERLHLRLVEEAALRSLGGDGFGHALPWADGVVRVPVVDLPDTVVTPPEPELRRRGDLAVLLDRAHRNTAGLVTSAPLQAERVEHEGRWFWCVLGDSFFTASMALVLPDLVERIEPGADLSQGVVFAVPFRQQIDFRVVDSASAALDALLLIPRFAVLGFEDSAGPLSPHTYLWHEGAVSQLTRFDDGRLAVVPGPHLDALLAAEDGSATG
jgi:hypothetical protein